MFSIIWIVVGDYDKKSRNYKSPSPLGFRRLKNTNDMKWDDWDYKVFFNTHFHGALMKQGIMNSFFFVKILSMHSNSLFLAVWFEWGSHYKYATFFSWYEKPSTFFKWIEIDWCMKYKCQIKGPIIYFFDNRFPSRHKQSFFI